MARPVLEVADIVRAHEADLIASLGSPLSLAERRVLSDIAQCRTAALGGHVDQCEECSRTQISYNSCRNRHCPKCQGAAREAWLTEREAELLPVEYFHIVFSVPHEFAALAMANKRVIYNLLFKAAQETLQAVARDPKHLGAEIGFLAVLHTWGQTLEHHPHVHCIVPGGGLSGNRAQWVPAKPGFFLPVRILSRLFRGKFLSGLLRAFDKGDLRCQGDLAHLQDRGLFRKYLVPLYKKDWFVYAKPPFGGPAHVLKYLSRYTHRVAISNNRLVALKDGNVSFLWKDYAHQSKKRVMTLSAVEFLRRFVTHILPRGFVRIRHYGFLANRNRERNIELIKSLLATDERSSHSSVTSDSSQNAKENLKEPQERARCPHCKKGRLVTLLVFERGKPVPDLAGLVPAHDTS
jgi:hypothetical protein